MQPWSSKVGMMRRGMIPKMETLLKKAETNDGIRKLCEKHPDLKINLHESLAMPLKLI